MQLRANFLMPTTVVDLQTFRSVLMFSNIFRFPLKGCASNVEWYNALNPALNINSF